MRYDDDASNTPPSTYSIKPFPLNYLAWGPNTTTFNNGILIEPIDNENL